MTSYFFTLSSEERQRPGRTENYADIAAIAGILINLKPAYCQAQGVDMADRHAGAAFGAERIFKDQHGRSLATLVRHFNSKLWEWLRQTQKAKSSSFSELMIASNAVRESNFTAGWPTLRSL